MRALAAPILALGGVAAADPLERIDTIGAVSAVAWDGRTSAGLGMRVVLADRFALGAQVRARDGELVENLDLVFQLSQGHLESRLPRASYPIRLDLLAGIGAVEHRRYATASFGIAMRIRASRRWTVDVVVRDEVSHPTRPNRFAHVPEVQLAVSWTARRPAPERR